MNLPREYFRICTPDTPGAQNVNGGWYAFHDEHCLALWMKAVFGEHSPRYRFKMGEEPKHEEFA
jgi:hypothetical protein